MSQQATARRATHTYNGDFNLAAYALAAADRTPDKIALEVFTGTDTGEAAETWTYAALRDAVARLAGAFNALAVPPGTRVLVRMDNVSLYPITFLASIAAGLVPIPTSSQLTGGEARFLAEDSGAEIVAGADVPGYAAKHVLSFTELRQLSATAAKALFAPTRANDPAYIVYTSGTTARPKGVVHAQRVILGRAPMYDGWYGITADDRMLHAGAFNWTYTLGTGLLDPWTVGATSLIYTGEKSPEIWPRLIRQSRATIFAAVPGLMRQILKYAPPGDLVMPTLRHGLIAGERPPETLFDDWRALTGTELHEALGMSELSTYISTSPKVPRKAGTTGRAQPGRRITILPTEGGETPLKPGEEGLLAVDRADPGLMLGYWQRPDEEAEVFRGPWFIGGDIATIDEDGYVTHLGRANDVMKALGYRVSPQEVEAALRTCPGISDVACSEVRIRDGVSIIGAFVIAEPDSRPSRDDVLAFASQKLADYKRPREVYFVDAFPRTANGKVRRKALAEAVEQPTRNVPST